MVSLLDGNRVGLWLGGNFRRGSYVPCKKGDQGGGEREKGSHFLILFSPSSLSLFVIEESPITNLSE